MSAVRSQGAGGQNVNKVASAIHLRFDIQASSLPDRDKERLLKRSDFRLVKTPSDWQFRCTDNPPRFRDDRTQCEAANPTH